MQIPYEVQPRPDTGLYNAKLGIWLFLASEVMLFGGLFAAYIFLRLGSDDGYWPHGLLNVPVGTMNTFVLILSSVTVIRAWMALKMRRFAEYKKWMGITIVCAFVFLGVKLIVEWPEKFSHFGAIIHKDKQVEYEKYLGNEFMKKEGRPPRNEISGHLHSFTVLGEKSVIDAFAAKRHLEVVHPKEGHGPRYKGAVPEGQTLVELHAHSPRDPKALVKLAHEIQVKNLISSQTKGPQVVVPKIVEFSVTPDVVNEFPEDPKNLRPRFWPVKYNKKAEPVHIKAEDVHHWSAFVPEHSTYFATYFMITGLHGLHVLGGALVFCFLWGPGAALYKKNPEHLANRVEVAGLFWHFVDLVWIFVFPLFYLL